MVSARPLLYTYRRCPYAMRARMALLLGGVAFDAHEIVLRDKPPAMLAASAKGTVPVLLLPEGRVLEESWDIVAWALTRAEAPAHARDVWARSEQPLHRDWLQRNDGAFKHHLDRYKYPERFGTTNAEAKDGVRHEHRLKALAVLLAPLEAQLAQRAFLGSEAPCAADLGVFPFVRQFAAVDPPWFARQELPGVQAWLARWGEHPLFQRCMLKLPKNRRLSLPFNLADDDGRSNWLALEGSSPPAAP